MPKNKLLNILSTLKPMKENKTIKDIRKENSNIDEIHKDIKTLFQPEPIKENKTMNNIGNEHFDNNKILRDIRYKNTISTRRKLL